MRILLVEDEEKVARFITLGLRAERFAVDNAQDGQTGLELATDTPYDLLIVDLMLPALNGTELIRRVRKSNADIPGAMSADPAPTFSVVFSGFMPPS